MEVEAVKVTEAIAIEVGNILAGRVTGITKFGAFVSVAPGKSGLEHISEIANTYVADVAEYLAVGQEVSVKVLGLENGKINLSIKATLPPAPEPERRPRQSSESRPYQPRAPRGREGREVPRDAEEGQDATFEDKLRRFMQDSDTKMSGARGYDGKKTPRRRGK
ncbi:MAG: S1 RNA-binding domain-containing protein [Oscillospiraceae bacterium]|jgi:S1 RNA binding domain protein|nr:S1 RNA-binding domain-containing protein [Oscillospiraceae bacterium]